jgi:hypothetical protein
MLHWQEDQEYLLEAMVDYRKLVKGEDEQKKAIKLTNEFDSNLHAETPGLHHRSVNAVTERLPYLDNLLAGVFKKENYAKKDQHLFGTMPRDNASKEPNLCNTRHSYNGAIK